MVIDHQDGMVSAPGVQPWRAALQIRRPFHPAARTADGARVNVCLPTFLGCLGKQFFAQPSKRAKLPQLFVQFVDRRLTFSCLLELEIELLLLAEKSFNKPAPILN